MNLFNLFIAALKSCTVDVTIEVGTTEDTGIVDTDVPTLEDTDDVIDTAEEPIEEDPCSFPTEVVDENGLIQEVDLPNELWATLSASTPSGAKIPGPRLEIFRFNLTNVHVECPSITVRDLAFEIYSTDNAQTGWESDMVASEARVLSTGAVIMGPVTDWDQTDLHLTDDFSILPSQTMTFSLDVDTTGASTVHDDVIQAELKADSIVVEIEGDIYTLHDYPITGGPIVF